MPAGFWTVVGLLVATIGVLLLIPVIIGAGFAIVLGSYFVNRANRIESRLRRELEQE